MSPLHTSSAAPLRDDAFPLPLFPPHKDGQVGTTGEGSTRPRTRILDMAVTSGIIALLVALLVPTLNSQDLTLPSATRGLVDHLRLARAGAASQGRHFRVIFQPQTYAIEQLQDHDGNGIWESDPQRPRLHVTLPPPVAIGRGAGTVIVFDARGMVATALPQTGEAPVTVELKDAQTDKSELIEILSSGRVQRS